MWVEVRGEFAIGQGGVELLAAIADSGSLAHAARHVGWSYRHAWGYVRRAERVLGMSLLVTRSGKGAARGTQLTRAAERLVIWFGSLRLDTAADAATLSECNKHSEFRRL